MASKTQTAAAGLSDSFHVTFPAIRGMQAGRHYFAAMCPLRLVARLFIFDEEEVQPEFRAQRTINRARIPEIARYIVENPKGYVFSSITVSIADTRRRYSARSALSRAALSPRRLVKGRFDVAQTSFVRTSRT